MSEVKENGQNPEDSIPIVYQWYKFFKINSNIFYCSSIGITDDTVLALVMFKSQVYVLFTM